jgi:hypothetical protein
MTSRRRTDAHEASKTISSFADLIQAPTANSLLMSQRLALETARFWARRMRAYADQMETLAGCASADDLASAQTKFLERMREDYAAESEAISALLTPEAASSPRRGSNGGAEADA